MNPQTSYFGVAVYCSAIFTGPQWESAVEKTTLPLAGVLGGQQGCLDNVFVRAAPMLGELRLRTGENSWA